MPSRFPRGSGCLNFKRAFTRDQENGKRKRLAEKVDSNVSVISQNDTPPSICLIDIHRVMRITGYKKSFIYEQVDFPEPVRLGTSRRSSVRWVEQEIYQWVFALLSKRNNTVFSGITDSGGNDLGILKHINKPAELKDKEYLAMKLPRHGHAPI